MIDVTITGEIPKAQINARESMQRVSKLMDRAIELNFLLGGRPAWPALKSGGETPLVSSGRLKNSREYGSGSNFAYVTVGKDLAYARIQREGGVIKVPINNKSRGYFWAMWYQTGDEKWKNFALSRRSEFIIYIPPREYLSIPQQDLFEMLEVIGSGIITFQFSNSQAVSFQTIRWS